MKIEVRQRPRRKAISVSDAFLEKGEVDARAHRRGNPDAVGTLIAAFDGAWQSIIASGARLSAQQRGLMRELLAKYIIAQARQGELDQCRLRGGALLHLAQSNLRHPPISSRP